jgi:hypothetical protein
MKKGSIVVLKKGRNLIGPEAFCCGIGFLRIIW